MRRTFQAKVTMTLACLQPSKKVSVAGEHGDQKAGTDHQGPDGDEKEFEFYLKYNEKPQICFKQEII